MCVIALFWFSTGVAPETAEVCRDALLRAAAAPGSSSPSSSSSSPLCSPSTACRRYAEQTVAKYGIGKRVLVAYCPEKPELATLERQVIRRVYLFAMIMAGMMGSALQGILTGS